MAWQLQEGLDYLSRRDVRMAAAIEEIGGIVRKPIGGVFEGLAQSIVGQQISMKAAAALWRRLLSALGDITPETVAASSLEALRACGLSGRKAEYLLWAARAVVSGKVNLQALETMDDESCIQALVGLKGVGRWTAEMLLIFSLSRPNVMSYDDYGLRQGLMKLYHHQDMPRARFERYRRRFAPYGTAASLVLWEIASGKAPMACAKPVRAKRETSGTHLNKD